MLVIGLRSYHVEALFVNMTLLDVVDCQVVQLRQVPLLGGAIGTALQDEVLLPIG